MSLLAACNACVLTAGDEQAMTGRRRVCGLCRSGCHETLPFKAGRVSRRSNHQVGDILEEEDSSRGRRWLFEAVLADSIVGACS